MAKEKKLHAAALRYDPEQDQVPVLAAYGEGYLAEKILEVAEENAIPVVEDESLAAVLSKLSVGDQIPPQLYDVVAKVLVYVAQLDKGYGQRISTAGKNKF